jgi:hypothetical protein
VEPYYDSPPVPGSTPRLSVAQSILPEARDPGGHSPSESRRRSLHGAHATSTRWQKPLTKSHGAMKPLLRYCQLRDGNTRALISCEVAMEGALGQVPV